MPADMKRYGKGWPAFSLSIRRDRAANRCECTGECGLHSTPPGPRRCTEVNGQQAEYAKGMVVLTTAHLCGCDPPCMIPEHVKAMCNRCHLRVDVDLHRQHQLTRKRREKEDAGQMVLI